MSFPVDNKSVHELGDAASSPRGNNPTHRRIDSTSPGAAEIVFSAAASSGSVSRSLSLRDISESTDNKSLSSSTDQENRGSNNSSGKASIDSQGYVRDSEGYVRDSEGYARDNRGNRLEVQPKKEEVAKEPRVWNHETPLSMRERSARRDAQALAEQYITQQNTAHRIARAIAQMRAAPAPVNGADGRSQTATGTGAQRSSIPNTNRGRP